MNSVAFSSDGERVISASSDYAIRIWDSHTGLIVSLRHVSAVISVAFSPGSVLGDTVFVWNAETGDLVYGHTQYVNVVAFSPNGKRVFSGSYC